MSLMERATNCQGAGMSMNRIKAPSVQLSLFIFGHLHASVLRVRPYVNMHGVEKTFEGVSVVKLVILSPCSVISRPCRLGVRKLKACPLGFKSPSNMFY